MGEVRALSRAAGCVFPLMRVPVVELLSGKLLAGPDDCIAPTPLTLAEVHNWHAKSYLASLYFSAKAALIAEVPPLLLLPSWAVRWRLLEPMQHQVRCWRRHATGAAAMRPARA